jgi:hypothetical protein
MSVEVKDITAFTGIEADSIEDFKSKFNENYIPKAEYTKAMGEVNGKLQTAVKKVGKDLGVELESEDWKKPLTEVLPLFGEKVKGRFTELEGAKSATTEEIENKYKGELDTYKQKVNDYKTLNETLKSQFEGFKTEVESEKKNFKVSSHFDTAFKGLNFAENVNEYTRKGFKDDVIEKYRFDLNDEGAPIVRDTNGNIVQSKTKAGTPATFEEVLTMELRTAKVPLERLADSKKVGTFVPSARVTDPSGGSKEPRRFTPRYR